MKIALSTRVIASAIRRMQIISSTCKLWLLEQRVQWNAFWSKAFQNLLHGIKIGKKKKKGTNSFFCSLLMWFCCCSNMQGDFSARWDENQCLKVLFNPVVMDHCGYSGYAISMCTLIWISFWPWTLLLVFIKLLHDCDFVLFHELKIKRGKCCVLLWDCCK